MNKKEVPTELDLKLYIVLKRLLNKFKKIIGKDVSLAEFAAYVGTGLVIGLIVAWMFQISLPNSASLKRGG